MDVLYWSNTFSLFVGIGVGYYLLHRDKTRQTIIENKNSKEPFDVRAYADDLFRAP